MDPDSDSDSERFPYGYSCTVFKFHIAQIQTQIPTLQGQISVPKMGTVAILGTDVRTWGGNPSPSL